MQPWFTLVCTLCQAALAPASPTAQGVSALTPPAPSAVTSSWLTQAPAPPGSGDPSVGEDFRLGRGRSLRVSLTPTPLHCAPLVELTF